MNDRAGNVEGDLAFACYWGKDRRQTWSGTPFHLMRALEATGPVADLNVAMPTAASQLLRVLGARRANGGLRSQWRHSRAALTLVDQRLQKLVRQAHVDRVLQIGDIGVTEAPFVVYQDLSYRLLREEAARGGSVPHFRTLTAADLQRLQRRQDNIYRHASGVIAMSAWLGAAVHRSGVPAERIHVIPPGVNMLVDRGSELPARRTGTPLKLLFIGRDFDTKAGDQVVDAFEILRRQNRPITLTVAGPKGWPRPELPPGVTFLGSVSSETVVQLFDTHDLFVMPSLFEGFGIVFIEALTRGLPCIGRRACAMPEIIDDRAGRLVETQDPEDLAELIWSTLNDDSLYESCAQTASERREFYSWERVARRVRDVMSGVGPGHVGGII